MKNLEDIEDVNVPLSTSSGNDTVIMKKRGTRNGVKGVYYNPKGPRIESVGLTLDEMREENVAMITTTEGMYLVKKENLLVFSLHSLHMHCFFAVSGITFCVL